MIPPCRFQPEHGVLIIRFGMDKEGAPAHSSSPTAIEVVHFKVGLRTYEGAKARFDRLPVREHSGGVRVTP